MAAAERREDWWLDRRRVREERMRYEVLTMVYHSAQRCADFEIEIGGFIQRLGVWEEELLRTLQYLHAQGYIRFSRGPLGALTVCLTVKGVDYIERDSQRRKSIREEPTPPGGQEVGD